MPESGLGDSASFLVPDEDAASQYPEIVALDNREPESLFVEATP